MTKTKKAQKTSQNSVSKLIKKVIYIHQTIDKQIEDVSKEMKAMVKVV